jgi:methyl-galactoside transport system substrate-binding protein
MMEQWLTDYPDQIELVICNNDDMALGAIDAIERAGILPGTIKLAGIDATPPGVEALKAGKLFGTVEADKEGYANAIFGIAASLSRGLPIDESIKLENGKYFWCSQKGLTQADIAGTDNK